MESVRSSNTPSLTIASCQHRNVANSRCCWVLTAPGLLMPLPRRRTPDIPARGPLAESRRREPIRCQSGSGTKSSYPRASRPYGVNHQYPTNAKSQTRTSGTDVGCGKRSAWRMSPARRMLTWQGLLAEPCLRPTPWHASKFKAFRARGSGLKWQCHRVVRAVGAEGRTSGPNCCKFRFLPLLL